MTKSTFHGAALLLSTDPGPDRVSQIVAGISEKHFGGAACNHSLQLELPTGMAEDAAYQLDAHRRDLTEEAVFLVIRPKSG